MVGRKLGLGLGPVESGLGEESASSRWSWLADDGKHVCSGIF